MKRKGILIAWTITVSAFAAISVGASETATFVYDARGRLVKVERSGTVNNGVTAEYKYDKGDNRITVNTVTPK